MKQTTFSSHVYILIQQESLLIHLPNETVNGILSVSKVTTFNKMVGLPIEASGWVVQLEWPQKVTRSLEIWTNCEDLMNQVLYTYDVTSAQSSFNNGVISDGNSLFVHLGKSTLVD